LNRFFRLHYLISLLLAVVIVSHLLILHFYGSSNPMGIKSTGDAITFRPNFVVKDLVGVAVLV